ncbi:MAG: hypothetical protein WB791_02410 [Waddliaceae bacterium]
MEARSKGKIQKIAAAQAGFCERSARNIFKNPVKKERHWPGKYYCRVGAKAFLWNLCWGSMTVPNVMRLIGFLFAGMT